MTIVVPYLCFYCISSGKSCACKSDSQAREAAAVICPCFIASARPIFMNVFTCWSVFYTKGVKSASVLCASLRVCHNKFDDAVYAL